MAEGRRKGLGAVVMILLALLLSSCVYLENFTPAAPRPSNAIPDDVRAALGCDVSLPGSGLGVENRNAEMLSGYRPASLKNGPALSVFWCAVAPDKFVLAFVRDGRLMHPECPPVLTWRYFPKAALSISDEPEPLEEFDYVENKARRAPGRPSGKTSGSIVVDGDDSLSNEFYCHKGAWMVRLQD